MRAAEVDQLAQREDAGIGRIRVSQSVCGGAIEEFAESGEAIGMEVDGVVARQERISRFGEQDDHQTHDHTDSGPIKLLGIESPLGNRRLDGNRMALDEQLGCLSNPLAEDVRQVSLAFSAIVDRFEEGARSTRLQWGYRLWIEQSPEAHKFRGGFSGAKPLALVPFDERIVTESGKEDPPLVSVGDERQGLVGFAHPLESLADGSSTASDPDAFFFFDKDREAGTMESEPQVGRFEGFTCEGRASPAWVYFAGSFPVS